MAFLIIPRQSESKLTKIMMPIIALGLTMLTSLLLFAALGLEPSATTKTIFLQPFLDTNSRPEILLKATPLLLIAVGLAIGYRANIWNIGAEGQFIMGAIGATSVAMAVYPGGGFWLLPLMIIAGMISGLLWAWIVAFLRTRFNTSEILVSLMLVYVAEQILRLVVSGPLMDPDGLNFPQSRLFQDSAVLPRLIEGTRIHVGVVIALIIAIASAYFISHHRRGFDVRVAGQAPRAARYSGVSEKGTVYFVLGLSGALAGLAGMFEVAGPSGQLTPALPVGYGFTAIIVAFLGRLNPWAIILAAIAISATAIGGESAQIMHGLPHASVRVIQGMMLFFLLGVGFFEQYKLKFGGA